MPKARKLPSGSWRCQVYSHTEEIMQPDGSVKKKRIYESFTCNVQGPKGKRIAEQMAAEFAVKKENRTSTINLTYGEALDKYIEQRSSVLSPATVREYKRSRRCDFADLMDIPLIRITQEQVQKAVNKEALTHSPKSVRNMHGLLSAVMNAYRPDFVLRTDLPKKVRTKIYVPSDNEISHILDFVKGTAMEIPILLAAFGPLRRSEICALDSAHIKGNIVHVEFAMVLNDNHEWTIKRPKSYAGDRYIEFPEVVINKLRNIEGRIVNLNPAQVSDRFADVLKRCGIPHFRFHDLRHYCASIQHAIGIPDSYIMERGGWGNDGVLKSVYRHVLEEKEMEMNNKANEYFTRLCNTYSNTK
ncbi:MAG: site-specific integrase [Blautia sp.]|jgi:integrase